MSDLTKFYRPESGYTKGDLITYYFNIARTILPHVQDRPLTLERMPEGVAGPYFYEKDAPSWTPDCIPTDVLAESGTRIIRYITAADVVSLL